MFRMPQNTSRPRSSVRSHCAFAPEVIFSPETVEATAQRFASIKAVKSHAQLPTRSAAVLVPLCIVEGQVSLLYTLRAPHLKIHRGQVSFPGGMADPADETCVDTALRETQEELGLHPRYINVWTSGNLIIGRGVGVSPVVGAITCKDLWKELKVNPEEVADVFAVPLVALCDPAKIRHTQFRDNYSTPVFVGGKRRIWGLTAMVTHLFLTALFPNSVYRHTIKYVRPLKGPFSERLF